MDRLLKSLKRLSKLISETDESDIVDPKDADDHTDSEVHEEAEGLEIVNRISILSSWFVMIAVGSGGTLAVKRMLRRYCNVHGMKCLIVKHSAGEADDIVDTTEKLLSIDTSKLNKKGRKHQHKHSHKNKTKQNKQETSTSNTNNLALETLAWGTNQTQQQPQTSSSSINNTTPYSDIDNTVRPNTRSQQTNNTEWHTSQQKTSFL